MLSPAVLGVDGARAGWVGVVLAGRRSTVLSAPGFAELVDRAGAIERLAVVAVDMPIGVPSDAPRSADLLARRRLGRASSTVFLTPVRDALLAGSYAEAVAASRERTGAGVSVQAFALRRKILEVEAWLGGAGSPRVVEVHPELSYLRLTGGALASKHCPEGVRERRRALEGQGISPEPGRHRGVAEHDVLDAAVAAWTARRVAEGCASCLPDPPELVGGWPAAIWT